MGKSTELKEEKTIKSFNLSRSVTDRIEREAAKADRKVSQFVDRHFKEFFGLLDEK